MDRAEGIVGRVTRAWRALAGEQRLAAVAALLMLLTLFLPWYGKSYYDPAKKAYAQDSLTGLFGSADFVMASVVLVALGVLAMLFARGEGRGFHLPGGDGLIIMIAGGWAALLIFYRVLDHPDVHGPGATIGIQWGIFVAFLAAALLVYAGYRIRSAHRPEPPLPLETPAGAEVVARRRRPVDRQPPRPRPRERERERDRDRDLPTQPTRRVDPAPRADDPQIPGQMSFDEAETERLRER